MSLHSSIQIPAVVVSDTPGRCRAPHPGPRRPSPAGLAGASRDAGRPPRPARRLAALAALLAAPATLAAPSATTSTPGGVSVPPAVACSPAATPDAALATAAPPVAETPPPAADSAAPTLAPERLAEHVAAFDAIWERVRDTHWDLEKVGAAWEAARDELRPAILEAESDAEARAVMSRLLATLGQSHFELIPASAYAAMDAESASAATPASEDDAADAPDADAPDAEDVDDPDAEDGDDPDAEDGDDPDADGWSGLEVRLVDDELLVTRVAEGSPAEAAGVRPGWILDAVDGRATDRLVELAREIGGIQGPAALAATMARSRLSGSPGSTIEATFLDGNDEPVDLAIELGVSPHPVAGLGNLPPFPVEIVSRTLDSGVGYFRLGVFFDPGRVISAWRSFLETHADAPGVILDLRGNPGGIILMSAGMLNFVVDERGQRLGTLHMRDAARGPFDMPVMINPRATTYDVPMSVLVDEMSMSNSEVIAAAAQDLDRATVVGSPTPGLVLPSGVVRLPNGDGLLHAFAGYSRSSGGALEGAGVVPDVAAPPVRSALLAGIDPAIATAVAIMTEAPRTAVPD